VRRLSAVRGFWYLLAVVPNFLVGGTLVAYGLLMTRVSLYRVIGFFHFLPLLATGVFLLCVGTVAAVLLRR
jgi:hypothetical protein